MKKITLIFAALAISASALFAQKNNEKSKKSPEEKAQKAATKWQEYLGLTDDQKQKFYDLKLAQINKMKTMKDSLKGKERKGMGANFKASKEDFAANVKTIFTPEQYDKWMAKRSEMKQKGKEKKGNQAGGNRNKDKKSDDNDSDDDDDDDSDKENNKGGENRGKDKKSNDNDSDDNGKDKSKNKGKKKDN
ncbi:MAG: hypothetical protein EAZ53_10810 [Bacteroidetes bacterium]|nr:MAG: hypothetical protein EAZ53_10810 [Bacteroidota bacterium]